MGRRTSFLGVVLRELERSANRAAADERRRQRRLESMQSRAFERELVRRERKEERTRIRAEREAGRRQNQESRDAQIRAWRSECEEYQEREQEIDRIANDSPEVEDRDRLYADLAVRRAFEPDVFLAPPATSCEVAVQELRDQAEHQIRDEISSFRPETPGARLTQIVSGIIGIGGIGLLYMQMYAQALASWSVPLAAIIVGVAGFVMGNIVARTHARRQREAFGEKVTYDVYERLQTALEEVMRKHELSTQTALRDAQIAHAAETELKRTAFERDEDERLKELRELIDGNATRMREALEAVLPLDLPVPCEVTFEVHSAHVIALEIDAPAPTVLPATEARLLSSGKVAYKEKSERRLNEQYLRLVTGLAIRHASEAMLNLPTCERIDVRVYRTALDASVGHPARQVVLQVRFEFPALSPLTMDDLDPVLALQHFDHQIAVGRNRQLQSL